MTSRRRAEETDAVTGPPQLPAPLQGALHSLYANYQKSFERWRRAQRRWLYAPRLHRGVQQHERLEARLRLRLGVREERTRMDRRRSFRAHSRYFSNEQVERWAHRPVTILVDSEQLDRGDALSPSSSGQHLPRLSSSSVSTESAFPAQTRETHGRGRSPGSHEHGRQAGQARKQRPLRRVCLDVDGRMGCDDCHPHPWGPGIRNAAALRAGRGSGPSSSVVRTSTTMDGSLPSTPRCTACRSRSFRHREQQGTASTPTDHPCAVAARAWRSSDDVPATRRLSLGGSGPEPSRRLDGRVEDASRPATSPRRRKLPGSSERLKSTRSTT